IEFRARDDALIDESPDSIEFALGKVEGGLRVLHFGHRDRVEGSLAGETKPRLDLSGVGFRFLDLRVGFGRREPDQLVTARNAAAAPDGGIDAAACGLPLVPGFSMTGPQVSAATAACS